MKKIIEYLRKSPKVALIAIFMVGYIFLTSNYKTGNVFQKQNSYLLATIVYLANTIYLVFGKQISCKKSISNKMFKIIGIVLIYPVTVFYCVEMAYNTNVSKMQLDRIIINCILIFIIEMGFLIAFQNYKCALIVLSIIAWTFGLTNHYLLQFKGSTL